jgi:hypothetical protein
VIVAGVPSGWSRGREVSLLIGQLLLGCGSRSFGGEVLSLGWRGRVVIAGGQD